MWVRHLRPLFVRHRFMGRHTDLDAAFRIAPTHDLPFGVVDHVQDGVARHQADTGR